ncbi:hypothetical protein K435DRAFT_860240 [Dendrothele bispora CBS 962.96]|uniref:Uncharacterized protein n=1 Tax=Dendrothele bispora (strain CBS 962.96) TaxID=1314807 RepID=A0A4S8LZJ1_DENBC|nr:hypothetical protein K435DRAFT_860240 [Dendrothele bispora CBS 962.96]
MSNSTSRPRKLRKKWLGTDASRTIIPSIPSPPPNASEYRPRPISEFNASVSSISQPLDMQETASPIQIPANNLFVPQPVNLENTLFQALNTQSDESLPMDVDCDYLEQLFGQPLLTFHSPLASPAQIISKNSSTPLSPTSTLNDISFSPPSPHFNQLLSALEISHPLKPTSSHKRKRSAHERLLDDLENIDRHLQSICKVFGSLGNFLRLLFWHPRVTRDEDPRSDFHKRSICNFLQGKSSVKSVHIVRKIYSHPNSSNSSIEEPESESERSQSEHEEEGFEGSEEGGDEDLLGSDQATSEDERDSSGEEDYSEAEQNSQ